MAYVLFLLALIIGGPAMARDNGGAALDPKALAKALRQDTPSASGDPRLNALRQMMPPPDAYPYAPFDPNLTEFRKAFGLGPNDPIPQELLTVPQPSAQDQGWGAPQPPLGPPPKPYQVQQGGYALPPELMR